MYYVLLRMIAKERSSSNVTSFSAVSFNPPHDHHLTPRIAFPFYATANVLEQKKNVVINLMLCDLKPVSNFHIKR